MDIHVTAKPGETTGQLTWPGGSVICALGRSGLIAEAHKREGDGATPIGTYPLRQVFYRADRIPRPKADLERSALTETDGWCDAPGDEAYNRFVSHPYPASAETLWRDDHLYDLIVVLGHNDDPPVTDAGSAIFFHVAKETGGVLNPTEGCIAVPLTVLERIVDACGPGSRMIIRPAGES